VTRRPSMSCCLNRSFAGGRQGNGLDEQVVHGRERSDRSL
jgi:hypothetical protein